MESTSAWQDLSLGAAGAIGMIVAVIHGRLCHRLIIAPVQERAPGVLRGPPLRLLAPLIQFSTFVWLLGGAALIVAALVLEGEARLVTGVLVAATYLYGVVGNLYATRAIHPGWVLMLAAVLLIGFGAAA